MYTQVCDNCQRRFLSEQDYLKDTTGWCICSAENLWFECSCSNTMMVPKGEYSWYSPEKHMSPEAATLFNRLAKKDELPHIPQSVMQLQQALKNPHSDSKVLAEIIKQDPLLAMELLSQANNLRMMNAPKIASLSHALSFLGHSVVAELALLAAVKSFEFNTKHFKPENFWFRAIVSGAFCEQLVAQHTKEQNLSPDLGYLAGSLCNIGKIVGAICLPILTDKIYQEIEDSKTFTTWRDIESNHTAPSHIILGEIACALWGMPKYISDAVRSHHDLPNTDDEKLTYGEVASLGNQLSHWCFGEPDRMDHPLVKACCQKMGLNDDQLSRLVNEIRERMNIDPDEME